MINRVYVDNDGCTWSLTPEAWRQLVEARVNGKDYDLDQLGCRLKKRRSKWLPSHRIHQWYDEDWADAMEELIPQTSEG